MKTAASIMITVSFAGDSFRSVYRIFDQVRTTWRVYVATLSKFVNVSLIRP